MLKENLERDLHEGGHSGFLKLCAPNLT